MRDHSEDPILTIDDLLRGLPQAIVVITIVSIVTNLDQPVWVKITVALALALSASVLMGLTLRWWRRRRAQSREV